MRQVGATLHRGAQASHYRGLSCCGAQAPDAQAQQLWLTGLVTPRHVGSSQTRARTRVPCIGRQTLNHCATREAQRVLFNVSESGSNISDSSNFLVIILVGIPCLIFGIHSFCYVPALGRAPSWVSQAGVSPVGAGVRGRSRCALRRFLWARGRCRPEFCEC